MQQRTIFSIILGVAILSISLFLLNTWLDTKNEGLFLTQDTYVGTVTWYEDATTPPIPSELKKSSSLIASAPAQPTSEIPNANVLDIITAAGPDSPPLLEPEIYDVTTGQFIKTPIQENTSPSTNPTPVSPPAVATPVEPKIEQSTPPQQQKETTTPSTTSVPQAKETVKKSPSTTVSKDIISPTTEKSVKRIFLTKDTKRPLRIEASHPITYKTFYLSSPERIVIDIDGKLNIASVEKTIKKHPAIKDVRIAYNGNNTRIVVDLVKKPKEWAIVYGQRKSTIDVSLQ